MDAVRAVAVARDDADAGVSPDRVGGGGAADWQ